MPQRQWHVPVTTGVPRPTFQLSSAGWARLEAAYGRPIPTEVRENIERATNDYLQLSQMEQNAEPLASASDEIASTHKAVRALIERLRPIQSCASDVHSFVGHLVSRRLKLPNRKPLSDHLDGLIEDLDLLSSALSEIDANGARTFALDETANAKIESSGVAVPMPHNTAKKYASKAYDAKAMPLRSAGSQQEGDAWRGWVRNLIAILKDAGLRAGVSKVSNYPLYRLVNTLRTELQSDRKISCCFPGALADAIYRAARGSKD